MIKAVAFVPNTPTLIGDLGVNHVETISALRSFGKEISGKIDAAVAYDTYDHDGIFFPYKFKDAKRRIHAHKGIAIFKHA